MNVSLVFVGSASRSSCLRFVVIFCEDCLVVSCIDMVACVMLGMIVCILLFVTMLTLSDGLVLVRV